MFASWQTRFEDKTMTISIPAVQNNRNQEHNHDR